MEALVFATPRRNVRPEDCSFYHVNVIPGFGQVGGDWDLRPMIEDYLGRYDFSGKKVLDVGTASGFLTFEMEKRGADVVSFDVESAGLWTIVPFHNDPVRKEDMLPAHEIGLERLKNSYWFSHERLRSSARVFYGNVFRLPHALGTFDAAMIGMCLPHIRDPLGALESVAARVKTVIMTMPTLDEERPIMQMLCYPTRANVEHMRYMWWVLSDGCIDNFMSILNFRLDRKYRTKHKCVSYKEDVVCTTFVYQRCT